MFQRSGQHATKQDLPIFCLYCKALRQKIPSSTDTYIFLLQEVYQCSSDTEKGSYLVALDSNKCFGYFVTSPQRAQELVCHDTPLEMYP